jgi:hypothetical protein
MLKVDAKILVESKTYSKHTCINGYTWYVPLDGSDWAHIQTSARDGYGGRSVNFRLQDNSIESVEGPWKVPSDWVQRALGIKLPEQDTEGFSFTPWDC